MNIKHPNGENTIVMVENLGLLADIEIGKDYPGWVTIGYVGSNNGLIVDNDEWESFVNLVGEIDAIVKSNKEKSNG